MDKSLLHFIIYLSNVNMSLCVQQGWLVHSNGLSQ